MTPLTSCPNRAATFAVTLDGDVRSVKTLELSVGIVVPVFNEAAILEAALGRLGQLAGGSPVVVVDGGSTDESPEIVRQFFLCKVCPEANRGAQLDCGARGLSTDVFLFLHADSQLPPGFQHHIRQALRDSRVVGGCFRLRFDDPHPLLRFYAWFTQFSWRLFHFGDQAFFVRREIYEKMGGYRPWPFLEDVEFLRRLRRYGRFVVLPVGVSTSARRFLRRGVVRQQLLNILLVALFELGASPRTLARLYPHIR